jgi:hypothetical protein
MNIEQIINELIVRYTVMEWLKNNLAIVIMLITIFGGVLALNDRYATNVALAKLEQQVVKTFEEHRKADAIYRLEQRYDTLGDTIMRQKLQMRDYPNDKKLKQEYDESVKEREKVKDQLDKMRNQ